MSSDRAVLLYTTRTLTCAITVLRASHRGLSPIPGCLFVELIPAQAQRVFVYRFAQGSPSLLLCVRGSSSWQMPVQGWNRTHVCQVPIIRKLADTAAACSSQPLRFAQWVCRPRLTIQAVRLHFGALFIGTGSPCYCFAVGCSQFCAVLPWLWCFGSTSCVCLAQRGCSNCHRLCW